MAYHAIGDYGIIGDLRTIALVSNEGSIDFMCLPHFDSPTIFAAMLDDEKGGRFSITPMLEGMRRKQLYLPSTNVLITRFLADDGVAELIDFMPVGQVRHTHTIVRRVSGIRGVTKLRLLCQPRFDYSRVAHKAKADKTGAIFTAADADGTVLRLRTSLPMRVVQGAAVAEFELKAGETIDILLELVRPGIESPSSAPGYAQTAFEHTVYFWRGWLHSSNYRGRWSDMVNRSALAMKLLCSASTGGIAAAATFGLPEAIGGERNWDYRFTWVRDASLTAASLVSLGFKSEARAFAKWVEDRYADAPDGHLQIMYGIDGRHDLSEQILDHLDGHRGSRPVRIGNGAYNQLQLDIYGELLFFLDLYDEHVDQITYDLWRKLTTSVEWIRNNWRRKDEGIWEVRGGQQEFLYSRITAWMALDRACRIAQRRSLPAPLSEWRSTRDEIYREVYERFWHDGRQAFVQYKGSEALDASALFMPMMGLISPRDPRWLKTLKATGDELVDDSLVYRYKVDAGASDGLSGTEGTFCMCSFWYIECLASSGDLEQARLLFEKMLGYANHLGLYAEELDLTGHFLGNFPQAFTHLGLVSAARCLDQALTAAGEA
jgi:GH15 family glucan-1,4-alpha-glucosidase